MTKKDNKPDIVREIGFALLAEGKTIRVRAEGYSMFPTIKPGSEILIEPLAADNSPFPGEIIAWKRESGLVVHRLIRISKNNNVIFFITRGDSCRFEDRPVTPALVAGKVTGVISKSGKPVQQGLMKKNHCYLYNRLSVWILLKIKRLGRLISNTAE
jgi:signal peptidase I